MTASNPEDFTFDELSAEDEAVLEVLEGTATPADIRGRLDAAIENEHRLKLELRQAQATTRALRRKYVEAKAAERVKDTDTADVPIISCASWAHLWLMKNQIVQDPEITRENKNARQKRYRDRRKTDPLKAEEDRMKNRERKRLQRRRAKGR
jgi:hypothetical protein